MNAEMTYETEAFSQMFKTDIVVSHHNYDKQSIDKLEVTNVEN